ncbi:MAG: chemotaxis protein CheR [Nitrospirae bacterium]|nr:chemotaxis protein CheR [Nitrospirota bacterium]
MKNLECTEFLQHYLPQLRFRWAGFRKVHKQVCKRLGRRITELGLSGFSAYKGYLGEHSEEWQILDLILQIAISRFYRDRGIFDILCSRILPSLAKNILSGGGNELNCWSAGCCSGEEPYSLQILWKLCVIPEIHQDLPLRIIATDIDHNMLKRAKDGYYSESSLRDLPKELVQQAFTRSGKFYTIKKPFTENIEFMEQDIREQSPEGFFHVIFCRNLVFTYFEEALQREILDRILEKLYHGGIFVIGIHESIPKGVTGILQYDNTPGIYIKAD